MARRHLAFKKFHPTTVRATDEFFGSKPWQGSEEQKQSKFETWLRRVSDAYGIPAPTLEIQLPDSRDDRSGYYNLGQITLYKWSVITLFHQFRHHMQALGAASVEPTGDEVGDVLATEQDAVNWACSLFYKVRPVRFRKLVRAGQIRYIHPDDLLTSESLAAARAARAANIEAFEAAVDADFDSGSVGEVFANDTLTTTDVMERLGRSRSWVCSHAEELGGVQDARGRWVFPASAGQQTSESSEV
jgi:hypothetical protein